MSAVERQPVARAVLGAAEATQQFILGLRALVHAVTELVRVQADPRVSAAVENRTREAVTAVLVLVSRTVIDTVTAEEDRRLPGAERGKVNMVLNVHRNRTAY